MDRELARLIRQSYRDQLRPSPKTVRSHINYLTLSARRAGRERRCSLSVCGGVHIRAQFSLNYGVTFASQLALITIQRALSTTALLQSQQGYFYVQISTYKYFKFQYCISVDF